MPLLWALQSLISSTPLLGFHWMFMEPSLNSMHRASLKKILLTMLFPCLHYLVFRFCHIVVLTADRFIAVTKPLRYASLVTFKRIAIVLGCLWLLSILSNTARAVSLAHGSHTNQDQNETDCGAPLTGTLEVTLTWLLFCVIVISMVALLTINALILHIAVKTSEKDCESKSDHPVPTAATPSTRWPIESI